MNETGTPRAKILIVDDSRTQLEHLRFLLEENGYAVDAALNGMEAIEKAKASKPSLIISDVLMPVMDGYEMCRTVKKDAALNSIPVMLLTTLSSAEDIIYGLNSFADYYITKPYDNQHLLAHIAEILAHVKDIPPRVFNPQVGGEGELSVLVGGRRYQIHADRRQMFNVILSTYEHAMQRNRELVATQNEMQKLNDELQMQQQKLQEANTRLRELATIDGLTGLKNHRAFQARLAEEMDRVHRYGGALSLLLLDVDHFKQYNDTFGHPAGDDVLKRVGQIMLRNARTTDFAARYGGEEFAVIMANTDEREAGVFAERVRRAIETENWTQRPITVSVGVSTLLGPNDSRTELILRTDKALYQSKQNGRNRVTHSQTM